MSNIHQFLRPLIDLSRQLEERTILHIGPTTGQVLLEIMCPDLEEYAACAGRAHLSRLGAFTLIHVPLRATVIRTKHGPRLFRFLEANSSVDGRVLVSFTRHLSPLALGRLGSKLFLGRWPDDEGLTLRYLARGIKPRQLGFLKAMYAVGSDPSFMAAVPPSTREANKCIPGRLIANRYVLSEPLVPTQRAKDNDRVQHGNGHSHPFPSSLADLHAVDEAQLKRLNRIRKVSAVLGSFTPKAVKPRSSKDSK